MSTAALEAQVVTTSEPLWFLGTLVRPKLTGAQTGGRWLGTAGPRATDLASFYVFQPTLTLQLYF